MPLIVLPRKKKPLPKSITVTIDFDCWNELLATGSPRAELERIINGWYIERLNATRDSYVIENTDRIKALAFGTLASEESVIVLREKHSRAVALGQHQKATALKSQILELERDLLLNRNAELMARGGENS